MAFTPPSRPGVALALVWDLPTLMVHAGGTMATAGLTITEPTGTNGSG